MRNAWKYAAVAAGVTAILASAAVRADDEGPWEVRVRALYLSPDNKSDAIPSILVPSDAVHINSKWVPDLDFEYFFSKHWSSELLLTYPQSQTVTVEKSALGGPKDIGTFKHLPPTLTAKYNFNPDGTFRPYLGAGVNLTLISNVDLAVPTVGKLDLNKTSVGPALQAGFDIKLADHWFANADVKWAMLRSDVKLAGTKITEVRIDPFLFGVGIGYRFGGSHAAPVAAAAAVTAVPVAAPAPAPVAAPAPAPTPPPPPAAPAKVAEEVVLKGVTFETASAKLRKESAATLDGVAASVLKCHCKHVDIRGYTDSAGKAANNLKLSENRATAVKTYLEGHGVPAGILSAQGFGEDNPIATNATAQGRAQNRRVTVQFTAPVGN